MPPHPDRPTANIVLVGFMGSGKSTVGQHLADRLRFTFVDTDAEVVAGADGRPITEIFAAEGESGFRNRESAALASLAGRSGLVVSTGGGIVVRETNRAALRSLGFVVWLDADEDELLARVGRNRERPLLQTADPRATIRTLLAERRPLYEQTAHLRIDTSGLSIDEVAYGIKESAQHFFAAPRS